MSLYYNKIIIIFCFLLTLVYFIETPLLPDAQYQWTMFLLTVISTISYFVIRKIEYRDMHWLSIVPIFILGYLIVFYQMCLLDLIGYEVPKRFYEFIWADESVMNKSIGVATLGLLAFYLGLTLPRKNRISEIINNKNSVYNITFLIIISYVFYILFIISSGSYILGVYAAKDASGSATYFYKLFNIALSSAIILKMSNITSIENQNLSFRQYLAYFGKPLQILLVWHLLFSLFVGDRGPVILYSLLAFGVYFIRWKRVNLLQIIITVFILSTLLTVIGNVRQARHSGVGYYDRVVEAFNTVRSDELNSKKFDQHVPGGGTVELALSGRTLNHVLFNVPDNYDYRYGLIQLQYIYAIIPGMASKINNLMYNNDIKFNGSSGFITYLIQGNRPTYGDGTSILADFYLDFGILGVIVGLYLFGYFVRKNELKLFSGYQPPTFLWIATMVFLSQALSLTRSSIGLELSNIVLIYILIKINIYIALKIKKRAL